MIEPIADLIGMSMKVCVRHAAIASAAGQYIRSSLITLWTFFHRQTNLLSGPVGPEVIQN
jgi:hypothetical protein